MSTIETLKRIRDFMSIFLDSKETVAALTDAIRQLEAIDKIKEFCNCRDVTPCYTRDAQIGFDTAKDMMLDRLRWAMETPEKGVQV